jgi:hypothetical protein
MDLLLYTPAKVEAVLERNDATDFKVIPRIVDNASSPYVGSSVTSPSVRLGEYEDYWAEFLSDCEVISAEPDDLFLPSEARSASRTEGK